MHMVMRGPGHKRGLLYESAPERSAGPSNTWQSTISGFVFYISLTLSLRNGLCATPRSIPKVADG